MHSTGFVAFIPREKKGHAVAILVMTPHGIPVVRDPQFPGPILWKLPGGRSNPGENPREAAIRELFEETGISIPAGELRQMCEEDKGSHIFTIFRTELTYMPELKERGDEGEDVRVFSARN